MIHHHDPSVCDNHHDITTDATPPLVSRRALLGLGAGLGLSALAACTTRPTSPAATTTLAPSSPSLRRAIAAAEAARPHTGTRRTVDLVAESSTIDLGGKIVPTFSYGQRLPGRVIRANVGDQLHVAVTNRLAEPTSVHWHGIALRNDMDGVTPATRTIAAGAAFTYDFSVPDPGTYWFHPHVGVQADYGLYGPLIVDDPNEKPWYDEEWIVMLDDWTSGVGADPARILAKLSDGSMSSMPGMSMSSSSMGGGMSMGSSSGSPAGGMGVGTSALLGGDAGDVTYPDYLINGRLATAPTSFASTPGRRIRIRIINAGADTAFRVALGEHTMTVTHTDGFPVKPVVVDGLLIGMGERYDVVVTAKDGVFPLFASAEGKNGHGLALLKTGAGSVPAPMRAPRELTGRIGQASDFTAAPHVDLAARRVAATLPVTLGGDMTTYKWTINGRPYLNTVPLTVTQGQRVQLAFRNTTTMWHPMHLHGHTFQMLNGSARGARKDTLIVKPAQTVAVLLEANNPGAWMLHCHNAYHAEAGMMTRLDYTT